MNIFTVQKTLGSAASRRQESFAQPTDDGLQFMNPEEEKMIGCISNHTESVETEKKRSSSVNAAHPLSGENRKDEMT